MARGRPDPDDDGETPPWMESRTPVPRVRAPAAEPPRTHTLVSWRALLIGAAVLIAVAIGIIVAVKRMSTPNPATVAADGQPPLIRAPSTPYKARVAADDAVAQATPDPLATPDASGDAEGTPLEAPPETAAPQRPGAAPTDLLAGTGAVDATADAPTAQELAPRAASPVAAAPPPKPALPKPLPAPAKPTPAPVVAKLKLKPAEKPVLADLDAESIKAKIEPRPGTAKPESADIASASALQLGAFSTREKADQVWSNAAAAHPELAALTHRVAPIERDGKTLYRLRATGGAPLTPTRCAAMKAMGAVCVK